MTRLSRFMRDVPSGLKIILGMAFLSLLTWLAYLRGLGGGFILDDYQNLKTLGDFGQSPGWRELAEFALSDVSGPLRRPVSLLSFALQHAAWPDDPAAFKTVNLVLHVLTGWGLLILFRLLAPLSGVDGNKALACALLAAALWLLAPLQASTVLYTVQRMTQLSALFSVLGMLAWAHGRLMLGRGQRAGWAWATGGVCIGGSLALLSKETGVLLPLYLLVLEGTLLQGVPAPKGWKLWKGLFLWGPLIGAGILLAGHYQDWIVAGYAHRGFSLAERMLTEPRVVVEYLRMALMPDPANLGVIHDDYEISTGWEKPVSTFWSLLWIVFLAALAWLGRRRWPGIAFAAGWFLGGHLLESTALPLELYFEHRNYLPTAGLYFGLVLQAMIWLKEDGRWHKFRGLLWLAAGLWLAFFAWLTSAEARLWGRPLLQAAVWGERHPLSLRARENWGELLASHGRYREAAQVFASAAEGPLHAADAYLLWIRAGCYDQNIRLPDLEVVAASLSKADYSPAPIASLEQLSLARQRGECGRLGQEPLEKLYHALLSNPAFAQKRMLLYAYLAEIQITGHRYMPALESLDRAYALGGNAEVALLKSRLLMAMDRLDEASLWLLKVEKGAHSSRQLEEARLLRERLEHKKEGAIGPG